jgi:hypothetical protein
MARAALHLSDRDEHATKLLAQRIIDLAKQGVLDPDRLCERALNDISEPPKPPIV